MSESDYFTEISHHGKKLKAILEARKISVKAFAESVGKSRNWVYDLFHDEKFSKANRAVVILELGLDTHDFNYKSNFSEEYKTDKIYIELDLYKKEVEKIKARNKELNTKYNFMVGINQSLKDAIEMIKRREVPLAKNEVAVGFSG